MLKQGKTEGQIIDDVIRSGSRRPLPKAIQEAPVLEESLELFYDAYTSLGTCRPVGFGFSPIPWTAVADYCQRKDFDEYQTEALHFIVNEMDDAIRKHEKETKSKGNK